MNMNKESNECKLSREECIYNPYQLTQSSLRHIAWKKHCGTYLKEFIELTKTRRSCIVNGIVIRNLLDTLEDLSIEVPFHGSYINASSELDFLLA